MMKREPAWRVFSQEYRDAKFHEASDEEHSPIYVITPLGARINRLFIVGTLIEVTNYGTEDEPSVRAVVADQTGHFYLTTGQYNPEVGFALLRAEIPSFVAIIGKAHVYEPEDGVMRKYVRPEAVIQVEKKVRDRWIVDTSKATWERMEAMREAMQMDDPTEDMLSSLGIYPRLARGAAQASKLYGDVDMGQFVSMLGDVLRYVLSQKDLDDMLEDSSGDFRMKLRDIMLSVAKGDDILWADVLEASEKAGMDQNLVRDEIDRMVREGILFERQIGVKLKIDGDEDFWK